MLTHPVLAVADQINELTTAVEKAAQDDPLRRRASRTGDTMWNHLPAHNLIWAQRHAALEHDGLAIKRAYDEGYHVEADRLLDALANRLRAWREDAG